MNYGMENMMSLNLTKHELSAATQPFLYRGRAVQKTEKQRKTERDADEREAVALDSVFEIFIVHLM